jgi:hypothetical protein
VVLDGLAHLCDVYATVVAVSASQSEKGTKLAQKFGQLLPFIAAFPQECIGQLASFGPT